MKRKTRKRLAKEAALAKAEARGDFSHLKDKKGNLKAEPLGQPTLPNVDFAFDDVDDDKHSQFHAYPPGRGPAYPPPPMSDFGGSDFYRPRPQHGYTPSLASNDPGWGPPPFAGQSAVSLVPYSSKGSDVGVDYGPPPPGPYGPPSYHSDHAPLSRSQTHASGPSPSPSPEHARNAAVYEALELPHASDDPRNYAGGSSGYMSPAPSEAMRRAPSDSPPSDYSPYRQGTITRQQTLEVGHHGDIGDSAYGGAGGDVTDFYDAYGRASVYQDMPEQPRGASAYEPPSRARLLERARQRGDDDYL
jgi:hypothetical protein